MSFGIGCRHSSDPALLWLWCRPATEALIQALAWEPPCDMSAALKKEKKRKSHILKVKTLLNNIHLVIGCNFLPHIEHTSSFCPVTAYFVIFIFYKPPHNLFYCILFFYPSEHTYFFWGVIRSKITILKMLTLHDAFFSHNFLYMLRVLAPAILLPSNISSRQENTDFIGKPHFLTIIQDKYSQFAEYIVA